MRNLFEKNRSGIAWIIVLSFVIVVAVTPVSGGGVSAEAAESKRRPECGIASAVLAKHGSSTVSPVDGLKSVAISGPTSQPAVSVSPKPTATACPVLTQKPNADILLGSKMDEKITLYMGDKGEFDIDRSNTEEFPSYHTSCLTRMEYKSSNNLILQVDTDGSYQAVGVGRVTVNVTGYNDNDNYGEQYLFERTYTIIVYPDMRNVTLQKTSVTIYKVIGSYYDGDVSVSIKINSNYVLDEGNEEIEVDVSSSNHKMSVSYILTNNVLTLSCDTPGTTKVKLVINGREFEIRLRVVAVKMSATSALLVKSHVKKLKVRGFSGKIIWKSSNKKVVSVNSKGRLKAKREGNAIISAKIGKKRLGCVVSVTTSRKKKAIVRAKWIAGHGKYSQPKRMQRGYYDCSSLVWRAYSPYGCKFGASGYAPVAADEAKWLAGRRRLLKGGYSRKNVQKLKIKAGDLLFETGAKNGRYRGIYHVEMFVGYEFYGFDTAGRPVVLSKWANRPDGYYWYGCGIVGRM